MRILVAVIDDLFLFARKGLFGFLAVHKKEGAYIGESEVTHIIHKQLPLPILSPSKSPARQYARAESASLHSASQYFIGEEESFLFAEPAIAFDTANSLVPYGEIVEVLKFGDTWASVRSSSGEGWILKDALKEKASDVFPNLEEDVVYESDDEETKKLRLCIRDMFICGRANLPLTDAEYVSYRLHRRGKPIPWSNHRPRESGSWQKILRGRQGIHIGINPKTGSIFEYTQDNRGHVCFVEAVFPNESIRLCSVGLFNAGEYNQTVLEKEAWRELKGVFIEVL